MGSIRNIIKEIVDTQPNVLQDIRQDSSGNAILTHVAQEPLEGDYVEINREPRHYSMSDFRQWGRSRAYFWGNKIGGDPSSLGNYVYELKYPMDKIYPMTTNPKGYTSVKDAVENGKEKAIAYYHKGKPEKGVIVVTFEPVKVYRQIT